MHIQDNFYEIIILSSQWKDIPMYLRDKFTNCITFDHRLNEIKTVRYTDIQRTSCKIQQLLKINLLLFHNVSILDPNRGKLTILLSFSNRFVTVL